MSKDGVCATKFGFVPSCLTLDKAARRITIDLCEAADCMESRGGNITERESIHRMIDKAFDVLEDKTKSEMPIERFATLVGRVK